VPAQLDHGGQFTALKISFADRRGGGFIDNDIVRTRSRESGHGKSRLSAKSLIGGFFGQSGIFANGHAAPCRG
jgi:hypothetical protein